MAASSFFQPSTSSASAPPTDDKARLAHTLQQLDQVQVNTAPLIKLIHTPAQDAEAVTETIRSCPALSTKVLSVINSAAFALPKSIDCVRRAVLQLGAARTHAVSLAFALRSISEDLKLPQAIAHLLWVNSLRKAVAAKLACEAISPGEAEQTYCHALIQDIALPMLISIDTDFYEQHMQSLDGGGSWLQQEVNRFGIDHTDLGHRLCHKWGLPKTLCESVLCHHRLPRDQADEGWPYVLSVFSAMLIPHLDEQPCPLGEQWMITLHGKCLSRSYPSPDAFLGAVNDEARRLHGSQKPQTIGDRDVQALIRLVTENTESLIRRLSQLEGTLGQAQKKTSELRFAAFIDPLTHAHNRRGFFELGEQRINTATIQNQSVLTLAIDLDHFKRINDTFGHDAGDRVLRGLVKCLQDNLNDRDLIGRLGGDEFAILIVDLNESHARQLTQHLCEACHAMSVAINDRQTVALQLSLGAAFCKTLKNEVTIDDLVTAADEAMYQRKHHGKGGYHFTCC